MAGRPLVLLVVACLTVSACAGAPTDDRGVAATRSGSDEPVPSPSVSSSSSSSSSSTTIENYPDAQTRALAARARERRPVEHSALPPRHLEPERHPESLVDRFLIVSGGPPPDGIASIDEPVFVPIDSVDWLADDEPVAVLTVDGETRIYPTQILIWHEIVNDEIAGQAVTMTYCPLCNSVVAVDSTIIGPDGDDLVLDFGTSGALYQSALVMYDRQTESLWTHFDGRAVMGTLIGTELTILPAAMVSWIDAIATHPDAMVLDRPTDLGRRPYGRAPYPNYETAEPSSGYITDTVDGRLAEKQRVIGIELDGRRVAIDRDLVTAEGVVEFEVGDDGLVALWATGTTSALDGEAIAEGAIVGSVGVFRALLDGRALTFSLAGDSGAADAVVDRETGSTWNVLGQAIAGPALGRRLDPVAHLDTFWFAWSRYHRDTDLID